MGAQGLVRSAFVAALAALNVSGCDRQRATPQPDKGTARQDAEARLFVDPIGGPAEIRRRIRVKVRFEDGFIVVRPDQPVLQETFVLAPSTDWTIRCGSLSGLSITFGTIVEGTQEDVSNAVEVHLADPPDTRCKDLELVAAKELNAITNAR